MSPIRKSLPILAIWLMRKETLALTVQIDQFRANF